jgi:NAD(P)H-flavin reductase
MLSMLDHLKASGQTAQPIRLLYGANRPEELFGREQLEAYARDGLKLTTEFCAVEGDAGWQGATGHVTGLLRRDIVNGGDVDVYLCGPPPMIDAGTAWLKANGVDERRIHVEKFLPS